MKTLVILNEKGGVGKTTLSIHAAWYFAERYRTLVLDLDQQANLSYTLEGHASPVGAVQLFERVTAIPRLGQITVAGATGQLLDVERADQAAVEVFRDSVQANASDYDVCVIDTPPILGMRTYAALLAADAVLAPVELGDYSLIGVQRLIKTIQDVAAHYGQAEPLFLGVLASKFDRRSPRERALYERLQTEIGHLLFPAAVTKRDAYARAASDRVPVWKMRESAARDAADEIRWVFMTIESMMGLPHA